MKIKGILLLTTLVYISMCLCSCTPSQREKAVAKTNEAKSYAENGDTLKAIETLAAIPSQFPKAKVQIVVSKNIGDELYRQLIDARKAQLLAVENNIATLETNFNKEKTEFDTYTQYIPKKLSFNKSWNKSFIQVNLDETGQLFLTSHYMGKNWLRHTAIKVYDEDLNASTTSVPLNDPNNRESDFLDYKWEKVAYTNGRSDSVITFIARNYTRDLKCVFIGNDYYYIILEEFNKEAITDALKLSEAIIKRQELKKNIKELEAKRNQL